MTEQNTEINTEDVNLEELNTGSNQESNDLLDKPLETEESTDVSKNDDQVKTDESKDDPGKTVDDNSTEKQQTKRVSRNKRRFDRVKERAEAAEAKLAQYEQGQHNQSETKPENDEPNPEKYENGISDIEYIKDVASFNGAKAYREAKAKDTEQSQQQQMVQEIEEADTNFNDKLDEVETKYNDFKEVWKNNRVDLSDAAMHALKKHPQAGELTYAILKNKDFSSKLEQATPINQIMMLGNLAAKLTPIQPKSRKKKTDFPDPMTAVESDRINNVREYKEGGTQAEFDAAHPIEDLDEF